MDMRLIICLSLLTCLNILSAKESTRKLRNKNAWKPLKPGVLLGELDLNTKRNLKHVKSKLKSTNKTPISRRRKSSMEENDSAATAAAQTDYDRTYDDFVRRYFDDAAERYLNFNDDDVEEANHDASNLSGSIEADIVGPFDDSQPFKAAAQRTAKKPNKNCKKVYKKHETCLICKNPRNNEQSETCSYEHASEPETFAYEKARKYHKNRNRHDDDDDVDFDTTDSDAGQVAETKILAQSVRPAMANATSVSQGKALKEDACIKRTARGQDCFYCRNISGELQVNCNATKPVESDQTKEIKPFDEHSQKQRQIFKRKISFVYEKENDSNGTLKMPN